MELPSKTSLRKIITDHVNRKTFLYKTTLLNKVTDFIYKENQMNYRDLYYARYSLMIGVEVMIKKMIKEGSLSFDSDHAIFVDDDYPTLADGYEK